MALGSRIWFGAVADQPWTAQSTPVGTMPLRSLQDIATYDLAVPVDGSVPAIDVLVPAEVCGALIEVRVEP